MLFSEIEKKHCFHPKLQFSHFSRISNFQGIGAIMKFQVFQFLFFFNFWRLESLMKIKSKNIQLSLFLSFFSNWIYFLEIDRVLDHVTRTNHVTRSRVSCWDHPGKSDTWSKWKYQIFDLTLIVIVAKGTNPKSKCSTITVTSSCLILATNDSAGVISLKTGLNWDQLETGLRQARKGYF